MTLVKNYLSLLSKKPAVTKSSIWADYLELLCLANIDGELSDEDVIKRLAIRLRDLKEGSATEISEDEELDSDAGEKASNRSRISDKWETELRDWFAVLIMRQASYKDFYPFVVTEREICLKKNKLSLKNKLYIYLLLCSNLNLFSKLESNQLSNSFELLSLEAFKNVMPNDAEVHLFGKNPLNKTGPFRGSLSLWEKIHNLASHVNESVSQRMHKEDFPSSNTGDGGLDIVGWIPTNDTLPSKLIFLVQCACGEWSKKVHESSPEDWGMRIDFTTTTVNNIFIPFCFKQANGGWQKAADIRKAFLVDRKRILDYCCKKKILDYRLLPAFKIVDEIVSAKESIL
ncbi:hypothetical protein [Ferruginibacter sp. SUN106]|uniref:hypothetical protein n=1 Tax=Ferruginibacter sp. SUN106 TaxID=2978348 RepID=UPI003D3635EB